jgi:hypothetical protein
LGTVADRGVIDTGKKRRKLHPAPQADNLTNWLINSIREIIAFPCGTLYIDMQQDLKWARFLRERESI